MTMIEAIQSAHDTAMERDEKVVVYGEDAGFFGGVFRCTRLPDSDTGAPVTLPVRW